MDLRINKISLYNINGIHNGNINLTKFNEEGDIPNLIGIFGPNGTGKTSVLEALLSVKNFVVGNPINPKLVGNYDSFAKISLEIVDNVNLIYNFFVKFSRNDIISEKLVIDDCEIYSIGEGSFNYPKIFSNVTDVKTLLDKGSLQSIFFRESCFDIIRLRLNNSNLDLFVKFFKNLTYISANYAYNGAIPIRLGDKMYNLLKRLHLTYDWYNHLLLVYNRLNIVLKKLLKRELILCDRGPVIDNVREYQTMVRYKDILIDITEESLGIKRLILYLIYLIPLMDDSDSCLCIDEIDSGIFELLLKELLLATDSTLSGQFVFTAHNFEAINVLQSESVVIATLDDNDRFISFNDYHVLDAYLDNIRNDQVGKFYEYINTYDLRDLLKGVSD